MGKASKRDKKLGKKTRKMKRGGGGGPDDKTPSTTLLPSPPLNAAANPNPQAPEADTRLDNISDIVKFILAP